MLQIIQILYVLNLSIGEADLMIKEPRWQKRYRVIDRFVDCCAKNRSTMDRKKFGEICATTKETDTERCSDDDHKGEGDLLFQERLIEWDAVGHLD